MVRENDWVFVGRTCGCTSVSQGSAPHACKRDSNFMDGFRTSSNIKKKHPPSPLTTVSTTLPSTPSPSTSNTSPVSNWDSEEAYSTDETVDEAPKTPTKRAANENVRSPGPESQEPTRKRRATPSAALEATLTNTAEVLAAYLKQQNADDSDKAFADYVHLTLKTFSKTTKNKAKIELMAVLTKYDNDGA